MEALVDSYADSVELEPEHEVECDNTPDKLSFSGLHAKTDSVVWTKAVNGALAGMSSKYSYCYNEPQRTAQIAVDIADDVVMSFRERCGRDSMTGQY